LSPKRPDELWDPMNNGASYPGVKRPGRGVDHTSLPNAEMKHE